MELRLVAGHLGEGSLEIDSRFRDGCLEDLRRGAARGDLHALSEDLERGAQHRLGQRTGLGDNRRERGEERRH